MKSMRFLIKSIACTLLLSQSIAQASLWSSASQTCSNAWSEHRSIIGVAAIAAIAALAYTYYAYYQPKQTLENPERGSLRTPKNQTKKRTLNLKKYEDHRWPAKPPYKVSSKIILPAASLAPIKEVDESKSSSLSLTQQKQALEKLTGQIASPKNDTRQVTFKSVITDVKKKYKAPIGTFTPSKFEILINGQAIGDSTTNAIMITNNRFTIRRNYTYEYTVPFIGTTLTFSGYREFIFELDPNQTEYTLDYDWHTPEKVTSLNDKKATISTEMQFKINNATYISGHLHEPGSEKAAKK